MNLNEQTLEYWIEKAKEIATRTHEGQQRTNGRPYIEHLTRVANKAPDRLKPIAFLHDAIEDHPDKISLENLKAEGFPTYILVAVDLLTHRKGITNKEYWTSILSNPDAINVKLLDIQDNLGESPNEYQKQKYAKALALFQKAGYSL